MEKLISVSNTVEHSRQMDRQILSRQIDRQIYTQIDTSQIDLRGNRTEVGSQEKMEKLISVSNTVEHSRQIDRQILDRQIDIYIDIQIYTRQIDRQILDRQILEETGLRLGAKRRWRSLFLLVIQLNTLGIDRKINTWNQIE